MKAFPPRHRRGFTLVEMLLVVTAVTGILAACAMLLHSLLRLESAERAHLADASTVSRIARQFREDVRTSETADPIPGANQAPKLVLSGSDASVVTYQVDGERLVRTETNQNKLLRRELYPLARLGPIGFEEDRGFLRLVLLRKPAEPGSQMRPRARIEARLGKRRIVANAPEDRS
jgi:prepilin-type N-terminal cleavage/methylation domain-containing protein